MTLKMNCMDSDALAIYFYNICMTALGDLSLQLNVKLITAYCMTNKLFENKLNPRKENGGKCFTILLRNRLN